MKTLILFVYCLFNGISCYGRENELCWHQCDSASFVAFINCTDTAECTCENSKARGDCTSDIGGITDGLKTWTECQEFAGQNMQEDGFINYFFRWENKTTEFHCYLLGSCKEVAGSQCAPFDGAPCVAGDSEHCSEEPDETDVCEPAVWDEADFTSLHWTCISPGHYEPISAYEDPLPTGTTCNTGSGNNEECANWVWSEGTEEENQGKPKIARVKCEGKKWVTTNDPHLMTNDDPSVDILPSDGAGVVNDGVCTCETLDLNPGTLSTPGLSLICDDILIEDADKKVGIESGNRCAFLCDGHFKMYIECYKGIFKNTAEYPFLPVKPDDITC